MSFKKSLNMDVLKNCELSMTEEMNQLRESIHNSIDNDLPLLKPNINFSQLIPASKKNPNTNNEMTKRSQLITKLNEMKAKITELNDENNEQKVDNNIDCNENDLDLDTDHTNRLQIEFPAFKRIVNTLTQNCEKHSIIEKNGNNCEIIDVNNEEIEKVLQISKHIQHFQNISQHLKPFENKK